MLKHSFDLAVFDLDGTLVHSAPGLHHSINAVLVDLGYPTINAATAQSYIGRGMKQFVSSCYEARSVTGIEEDEVFRRFRTHYRRSPTFGCSLYEGVTDTLEALSQEGFKLAVCTNKDKELADLILEDFDLTCWLSLVVGGDELCRKKPDPSPLLHVVDNLKVDRSRFLFVGDSEVDAETAMRASCPFYLFENGYRRLPVSQISATRSFSSFNDLTQLILRDSCSPPRPLCS